MNVTFDTALLPKESRCSCNRCDSDFCLAIRNTDILCYCNPCPSEKETNFVEPKECNLYQDLPVVNVIASNGHEAALKDELDKYDTMKTECLSKKQSNYSNKEPCMEYNTSCLGKFIDEDHYLNASDNSTPKGMKSPQLSGQILNLQCNVNNKRISHKRSVLHNIALKYPNDIFKRIRDVYKACSCKVCECIVGKSTMNKGICDCKPCACNTCKFALPKEPNEILPVDDEGCPCVRCDRKEHCKGVCSDKNKSAYPKVCDCNLSHQNSYNYQASCDCKPCQCIDCQVSTGKIARRQVTLIVAPMEQNFAACDCAPCECSECIKNYRKPTESPTHQDASTGINLHPRCQCEACDTEACIPDGYDSCWCVRQNKIMSKPLQKNNDEYDIRRMEFSNQIKKPNDKKGHNTVAMFAKIIHKFPQKAVYSEKCTCGLCECIVCSKKENTESVKVPERDCESNRSKHFPHEKWLSSNFKKYACNICECIDYESRQPIRETPILTMHTSRFKSVNSCKNSTSKEYHTLKHDDAVKTRENQNISVAHRPVYTFQNTVHSSIKRQQNISDYKGISLNTSGVNSKTEKPYLSSFHKSGLHYINRKNTQLQEAYTQKVSKVRNITNIKDKRSTKGEIAEDPSIVFHASLITDSRSSNKKSRERYLNTSGLDYGEYLIHFPKNHVEEYINDVMKTSFSTNVDYDKSISNKPSLKESTNSSLSPKQVNEKISSKKMGNTEEKLFNVLCRDELNKNTQKKDSLQELIDAQNDYYSRTKSSITAPLLDNYRKVHDILKEAREFSQHLVKLLQKYEEANKRFDSASSRFKKSNLLINQEELINDQYCETIKYDTTKNKFNTNNDLLPYILREKNITVDVSRGIKTKTYNSSKDFRANVPTENIKELANKYINNKINFNKTDTGMHTDPFYNNKFVSKSQTDHDNKENNYKESLAVKESKHLKENEAEKKKKNKGYKYKRIITSSKQIKIFPKYTDLKYDASIVTGESSTRQDETVTNKEVIHVSKSIIALDKLENVATKPNPTSCKPSDPNSYVQSAEKPKSSIVIIQSPEDPDNVETPKIESIVAKQNNSNKTEFNIRSKANVIPTLPSLEIAIKDAIRLFSSRSNTALKVTSPIRKENEGSVYEAEAKKLRDSKVLQPFIEENYNNKEHVELNEREAKSKTYQWDKREKEQKLLYHSYSRHRKMPADNYDVLQVNNIYLRKVSDHTVLVKWNAPEDIARVQGYEILVDGRLVHKIYNSAKCMAVVTCLPASKKVLITVKTVPNIPDVQRMLATTIIYRPKK